MRVAIMQPYFLPYIGYWQLIQATDVFVLLDDVQYMRHGWINRNRILKPTAGLQYFMVPLEKHAKDTPIRTIVSHPHIKWKERILGQLEHYRTKAPFFHLTISIVRDILYGASDRRITHINLSGILKICTILGVNRRFIVSSEQAFDYAGVDEPGDWALRISEQLKADEYINPVSGKQLFRPEKFAASGIKLSFLRSELAAYQQRRVFEPALSIVDVLMFNGIEGTQKMLQQYAVEDES